MNKGQKTGLGLNLIGVALFVIWLIIRSNIPTSISILVTVVFLGLLGASLFLLIYATRQAGKENRK
jgi:thiol:disulfide interchange protein